MQGTRKPYQLWMAGLCTVLLCLCLHAGALAQELPVQYSWYRLFFQNAREENLPFTLEEATEVLLSVANSGGDSGRSVQAALYARGSADGQDALVYQTDPLAGSEGVRRELALQPGDYRLHIVSFASCSVTVEKNTPLSVSSSAVSLAVGKSQAITVVNSYADEAQVWSSSNAGVAEVSPQGVIVAKAPGTATVKCAIRQKSFTVKVYVPALSQTSLYLLPGKKATVTVSNAPKNATVKWTTGDKTIATVSSKGAIKAVAAGKTTITCTVNGAKLKVTVYVPSVGSGSLDLPYGTTQTLKVNNGGKNKVTWSSSDTSVVTVSAKGVVKGKKLGTATITAQIAGVGKVKCKVTVIPKLSQTAATLKKDATLQMQVKGNGSQKAVWKSSKTSVARVNSKGLVRAVGAGTAVITCTVGKIQAQMKVNVWTEDSLYKKITVNGGGITDSWFTQTTSVSISFLNKTGFDIDRIDYRVLSYDASGSLIKAYGYLNYYYASVDRLVANGSAEGSKIILNGVRNVDHAAVYVTAIHFTNGTSILRTEDQLIGYVISK